MGSRKLPKMARGMGAPAGLPASTAIVARAGIGFRTVICARPENAMTKAAEVHNAVRKDDIRGGPGRVMSAELRRRPVCFKNAGIAKGAKLLASLRQHGRK